MTVHPGDGSPLEWETLSPATVEALRRACLGTLRGPHGDAPHTGDDSADTGALRNPATAVPLPDAVLRAHFQLGRRRLPGATNVAVVEGDGELTLLVVTDQSVMLMDSVTVLLHRLGVAYVAIMNPMFAVTRGTAGELIGIESANGPATDMSADRETWINMQLAPSADRRPLAAAQERLPEVLADTRQVALDDAAMAAQLTRLADAIANDTAGRFPGPDRADIAELLRWLGDGHFVLLGYQRCPVDGEQAPADQASRLGVLKLRDENLPALTTDDQPLVLAQATTPSYLRYGAHPYIVVLREKPAGHTVVEHRFVGLFTVAAMNANVLEIPLISRRVLEAMSIADRDPSQPGQMLLDVIQTVPRSELFALDAQQLHDMALTVMDLGSRRRTLLFARADQLGHFVSCLVYLPRDRYTTAVRLAMQDILVREFGGVSIEYSARVSESPWALVHFTVKLPDGSPPGDIDVSLSNETRIQHLLTSAARTWADRLLGSVSGGSIRQVDAEHYATAFPESYRQVVSPTDAIADITIIEALQQDSIELLYTDGQGDDAAQIAWYLGGRSASLSELLPMLQSMGVIVLDERPFTVRRRDGLQVWIYRFRVSPHPSIPPTAEADRDDTAHRFADAVIAIWQGWSEVDRFNELVLRAGLRWQQVAILRAYAKYLRQVGFPYSQSHIEAILNGNASTARSLVELFEAVFDPALPGEVDRTRRAQAAATAVAADIDALVGLDTDRVLRAFASLTQATLRTNCFVTKPDSARAQGVLSFKLNPTLIDEVPLPRPRFEIFVYSPRVEGVHLRFGPVARGGLRWSDRREDFRTEILGLVKAQAVKNAVIVPVGAKGGFVVKNPPQPVGDPAIDRDNTRNEGVACYRLFIGGLLDVTDNVDRHTGNIVTPTQVVCRDGADAYLVVAADKGTATFSDIANDVAASYGFWLGDAFASGGSVGYDHKAMGITAKGAWESVKRHFREMDVDTQSEDFTVVGIGDMSGDVFGNGMLLSEHIRLVAAFNHLHVFIDPNPDAATSWAERKRLFALPRSSWADYDTALISAGGGVFRRDQKTIGISEQMRATLGLDDDVAALTPPALVKAILRAPVDLIWNGGIGTYVKSESESDADVGDRANDLVRVNANELRAKVIGEGGNLGVTPRGRVEFDLAGGRINTDALDNSAGVDCSDHEVNIKILIDDLVSLGKVTPQERGPLLESMTEEVGDLVLRDNISQNDLLGTSRATAAVLLNVHARQIKELEATRGLSRELEALPTAKEIRRRTDLGLGLTSPELATLMAHAKLALKEDVLAGDMPDQDVFAARLRHYFPTDVRDRFTPEIRGHQLRREIVTTMLINDLIDTGGISFAYRVTEDIGVSTVDAVRTYVATDAVFGAADVLRRIQQASRDNRVPVQVSDRMTTDLRRLIDRAARWFLNYRPQPLAVGAEINRFAAQVAALTPRMLEWLRGDDRAIVLQETDEFAAAGMPRDLAFQVSSGLYQYSLLDIIDIADITDRDTAEVADTYFALMDDLGTDGLLTAVSGLPRDDRWHALARLAVRDDIYSSLRLLTLDVLAIGEPEETGEQKIAEWQHTNASRLDRARRTLKAIYADDERDLATLSVAARQIRNMTRTSGMRSNA
jgi:glutamate dehydrogenase